MDATLNKSAGVDIVGLDIDGPYKLLLACHFQSYEDMKKCIETALLSLSFSCKQIFTVGK